jgi:hypothetical protein
MACSQVPADHSVQIDESASYVLYGYLRDRGSQLKVACETKDGDSDDAPRALLQLNVRSQNSLCIVVVAATSV